ncbi:MAG TPA: hypothetical protein VF511_08785, partial [Chthoniobacterales bacterium]
MASQTTETKLTGFSASFFLERFCTDSFPRFALFLADFARFLPVVTDFGRKPNEICNQQVVGSNPSAGS